MYPAPKYKIEVCGLGERAEVPVARDERNTLVDTTLGNQRIAETGLAAPCEYLSPQRSRPLPITRCDLDQRYFRNCFGNIGRKLVTGVPIEDWMPVWSSALFGVVVLSAGLLVFSRRNY